MKRLIKYLRNSGKQKQANPIGKSSSTDLEPAAKKARKEFKQYPRSKVLSVPAGEDEVSNARNRKLLLSEEKKLNPNKHTVNVLMDRTFVFRRLEITKNPSPI